MKRVRGAGAGGDRARANIASAAVNIPLGVGDTVLKPARRHIPLAGNARKQKKERERHQEASVAAVVLRSTQGGEHREVRYM